MSTYIKNLVKEAKISSYKLTQLTTKDKNKALKNMAKALIIEKDFILRENKKDIAQAVKNNLKKSFIDRLSLNDKRLNEMSASLKAVASLADPIGKTISSKKRPNQMVVKKIRVPIGVVLIVYEARPNVTSDCISLLFKTSNVGILRGGGSSINSNKAIGKVLDKAIKKSNINFPVFFIVDKTEHKVVNELLEADQYIDLVIPRGGEALIRKVTNISKIPVIKHYKGVCHIYIDKKVNLKQALEICVNSKVQRPSVCNAVETILVHKTVANKFLPLLKIMFDKFGVEIRGDSKTVKLLSGIKKASDKDWTTEYLDLIISIKIVESIEQAIEHINLYGSHHTDSILTKDISSANKFTKEVDSACCFSNISTRFSDGYQFGLGAEIGISTDKLHARGPMGLEELTIYKYVVVGTGQIRV
ncbi:MAG: glutamate-5-semialdehyde dehydrogenase [Candidatus Susulua stagnicola]|nr:glutamate-5-semialdehyde dehydrogenase [Candidatus Susulua stagnicola]